MLMSDNSACLFVWRRQYDVDDTHDVHGAAVILMTMVVLMAR